MKTKEMTKLAMMVALTVTLSILFIIPIPATKGFVTLCEVGIYASAMLFGPTGGFLVGALSGWLDRFDFWISGMGNFFDCDSWTTRFHSRLSVYKFPNRKDYFWILFASLFMIIGYAIATALLFGWPAGLASLPGNLVQNIFGIAVTIPLYHALQRVLRHPQYK